MASGGHSQRLALVLSGGGARGAYEAGVLSYLFSELGRRLGRPLHFDIITGTSVGAIHACYVAASQQDPRSMSGLLDIWHSLDFERVLRFGMKELLGLPSRLLAFNERGSELPQQDNVPKRLSGLFDTSWLESIVLEQIAWPNLRRALDDGFVEALAIAATEIGSGRSAIFVDNGRKALPQWSRDPSMVARRVNIGPAHALASAAIPLAFPAICIERTYYYDGGLRLNTPLSPALRLGADSVLVIGLRHPRTPEDYSRRALMRPMNFGNPTFLAGKALNALLLDRIEHDVDRLRLFNSVLESGTEVYGPDFLDRINVPIVARRGAPYRVVRNFLLEPSRDLGTLAAECFRRRSKSRGLRSWLSPSVAHFLSPGRLGEADLLSYLFFDRHYVDRLIALGRRDAEAASDRLVQFLS